MASFNSLSVTQPGMYLLLVNVRTVGSNDYNFNCLSKPIIVKKSSDSITKDETIEPNIYFTFSGKFSEHTAHLDRYESMLYNCFLVKRNLYMKRSMSLYAGSIKVNLAADGDPSSYSNLTTDLNGFSLADGVVLQSATILGKEYTFSSDSASSDTAQQKAAQAEKQNAVSFKFQLKFFPNMIFESYRKLLFFLYKIQKGRFFVFFLIFFF